MTNQLRWERFGTKHVEVTTQQRFTIIFKRSDHKYHLTDRKTNETTEYDTYGETERAAQNIVDSEEQ